MDTLSEDENSEDNMNRTVRKTKHRPAETNRCTNVAETDLAKILQNENVSTEE